MEQTVLWAAAFWGAVSAASLPLGSLAGLAWQPPRKVSSSMMAFGGGALLFALSIELFGHVLHRAGDGHGHITQPSLVLAAVGAAICGGLLFNGLNRLLEGQGGFLRKRVMIRRHVARQKRAEARRLIQSLSRVPYFQALPVEEIVALMPDVLTIDYPAGVTMFSEGDAGDGLFVIAEGQVEISRTRGVAEPIVLTHLGPGEILGELALITDQPRSATARTQTPVRAWRILKRDFLNQMASSPRFREAMQKVVASRVGEMQERGHEGAASAQAWAEAAMEDIDDQGAEVVTAEVNRAEQQKHGNPAMAIWLGILLDGIPESLVIGMLVVGAAATGQSLSLAFIAGVFLANLPEAMSSSATMKEGGMKSGRVFGMWFSLCVITAAGALLGASVLPPHPDGWHLYMVFAMEGLAGGAMLTMIAQTMLPEAFAHGGGPLVGLSTLGGFLAALMVKLTA